MHTILPRRPASPIFLARRLAAIAWFGPPPAPGSRPWLVETCRAELAWALADWRLLTGTVEEPAANRSGGPHPSEAHRLPHEVAAARVVNCHLHVDVEGWRIRTLLMTLRRQRRAACDGEQADAYRLSWMEAAAGTLADLVLHRNRRRVAWDCFLAASAEYRRSRATLDGAHRLAA